MATILDESGEFGPQLRSSYKDQFVKSCQFLSRVLSDDIVNEEKQKVDPLAIAYQRFTDALFLHGAVERRIASAVMGVESLFMTDKDAIGYKLSMRLAKLLGKLGYDPVAVQETMKDSYSIRSSYVHGDRISSKELNKLNKRHLSLDHILTHCLSYLRSAMLFSMQDSREKDWRIKSLDRSMLLDKMPEDLVQSISNVTDVAGPVNPATAFTLRSLPPQSQQ